MTHTAEWGIDEEESKLLAGASANVARHYGAEMTQKTIDWTNLAAAIGMVYGTRIFAISAKRTAERKKQPTAEFVPSPAPGMVNGAGAFAPPPPPPPRHN